MTKNDSGTYMCQGRNSAGYSADVTSLFVEEGTKTNHEAQGEKEGNCVMYAQTEIKGGGVTVPTSLHYFLRKEPKPTTKLKVIEREDERYKLTGRGKETQGKREGCCEMHAPRVSRGRGRRHTVGYIGKL